MESLAYTPHDLLKPYVQAFVYSCVGDLGNDSLQELELFPLGYSLMGFILTERHHLFNSGMQRSYDVRFNFTGQLDRYHHLVASSSAIVYVLFKPFGAYRLLGIPQHLFKNECMPMADVYGSTIRGLFSRLEDQSHDHKAIITLLEEWLLAQFYKNSKLEVARMQFACHEITKSRGAMPVTALNSVCCMSKSSMEYYFKEQVGLSPKLYSRIVRFNQITEFLKSRSDVEWLEIVDHYGYFDQAHFIHEFKHFYGYSPSQMHQSYQNLAQHIGSFGDKQMVASLSK